MSNHIDAQTAHARLCQALTALHEAECNAVILFAEILQRRFFRELGFASIHIYANEALGFSRRKTYEFIRLAEALDKLPELKASIKAGKVPWTKAREVVKVATPLNEKRWIEIAESGSRGELQADSLATIPEPPEAAPAQSGIISRPPEAVPVQSVTLRLAPLRRARFDSIIEKLMKSHRCSRDEIVLMALEALLGSSQKSTRGDKSTRMNSGAPYQVIVHQCETCKASTVGPERGGKQLRGESRGHVRELSRSPARARRCVAAAPRALRALGSHERSGRAAGA